MTDIKMKGEDCRLCSLTAWEGHPDSCAVETCWCRAVARPDADCPQRGSPPRWILDECQCCGPHRSGCATDGPSVFLDQGAESDD
jgi:hypothetical protein